MICLARPRLETCLYFNLARQLDEILKSEVSQVDLSAGQSVTGPISSLWGERGGSYGQGFVVAESGSYCVLVNKGSCISFVRTVQHFLIKNKKTKYILSFYGPVIHLKASHCSQLVGEKSNWSTLDVCTLDVWQEANSFFVLEKASSSQSCLFFCFVLHPFPDGNVK